MSTIHAPDFYEPRRKWRTKKRDEFLRENVGIDTAILADGLGVSERFIISYQRKLGVRPFTGNPPRKGVRRLAPALQAHA